MPRHTCARTSIVCRWNANSLLQIKSYGFKLLQTAAPIILREDGFLVLGAEPVQTGGDTFSSTPHPCKTSRINKCMALSCTGGL